MSNNELITTALNWRYATKGFDASKKITETDFNVIVESLRLAPSSYGLQPWKFIIVKNPEVRQKLREVSWNQSQVTDASHYIVFTALDKLDENYVDKYITSMATQRGIAKENLAGLGKMIVGDLVNGPRSKTIDAWAQRQAYIAMGQVMFSAAIQKIDSCPLEGLDPAAYNKILGLEGTGYSTIAGVAFGYRNSEDKYQNASKVRFDVDEVFQTI